MRWRHADHPDRTLRLAYCLNLHAAEDLAGLYAGLRAVTLPLRERIARGRAFGVGMWTGARVARELASASPGGALAELADFLAGQGLDAFTFNAFPYGGFQRDGLKADVYRPTWQEEERLAYTLDVASIAARLNARSESEHVSISTHPGSYGAWIRHADDFVDCARTMAGAVEALARIEAEGGPRTILALEAEPLASASDSRELAGFLAFARAEIARALAADGARERQAAHALAARHLGTCLDACHSAVEFEEPSAALALATRGGPLGKLQFSSALALASPARDEAARAQLLALAEPRFLHQVAGRSARGVLHAEDLPDLARALADDAAPWLACEEWRCHFHLPVDLDRAGGLATTRAHADALLERLLADPAAWGTSELHVEIETYTWDVLPREARGAGELVDGLEREYRHVMDVLSRHGWHAA